MVLGENKPETHQASAVGQPGLHNETPEQAVKHLRTLLRSFSTVMFNTRSNDNHLRSCPMVLVVPEDDLEQDVVYTFTLEDTHKVDSIRRDNHINLAFQSGSCWVSVCCTAQIIKDKELMNKLWNDAMRTWFPEGLDTTNLAIIKCHLHQGEYWDQSSLTDKVKFYYETGMAYLQGRSVQSSQLGTHEKVNLSV